MRKEARTTSPDYGKLRYSSRPHYSHSIVSHRHIVLILRYKIKVITPKHRRPDRHNLSLMNPQQYFFGGAIVDIGIDRPQSRTSAEHIRSPKPSHVQ
jgi:hypothetical protein